MFKAYVNSLNVDEWMINFLSYSPRVRGADIPAFEQRTGLKVMVRTGASANSTIRQLGNVAPDSVHFPQEYFSDDSNLCFDIYQFEYVHEAVPIIAVSGATQLLPAFLSARSNGLVLTGLVPIHNRSVGRLSAANR